MVGAGLTGLTVGSTFVREGVLCSLLEKSSAFGGVWRWHGNPFSRVNTTEPGYRLRVKRPEPNTNHSYSYEILTDCQLAIEQHGLAAHIHCNTEVTSVFLTAPASWTALGSTWSGRFSIRSEWAVLCTNRRLGTPRVLPIATEDRLAGDVRRGIGNDTGSTRWTGKAFVVLGHGPYALENMRTALENGANRVTHRILFIS